MTVKIGILALEGCVGLSLFAPADLFNTANMIADRIGRSGVRFSCDLVSMEGDAVRTSSGHEILTQKLGKVPYDVVIIPGIGASSFEQLSDNLQAHHNVPELLCEFADRGSVVAAACTGTFILGRSGLLDGLRATTTWWMAEQFRAEFPEVELVEDELLVDEDSVITSAAGASSLDLSLHLITRFAGPNLSRLSAKYLIVDGGRKSQRLYSVPWHSRTRDPLIERADEWIRRNRGVRLRVDELARHLGIGERSLLRKFRELTGTTPQSYIQNIRVDFAKLQLEGTQATIAQVAAEAGFSDENAFRRAFAQRTGISPSQYRKQFR